MQAINPYYFALSVPVVMALMACMCLIVWRQYRQRRYLLWMAGNQFLLACALTGQTITRTEHAYISTLWVTALYLGSSICLHRTLHLWLGKSPRWLPLGVIAAACLAAMWFFLSHTPQITARISTVSLGMAGILLWGLPRVLQQPYRSPLDKLIRTLYVTTALCALLRPLLLISPVDTPSTGAVVAHSLVWWATVACMLLLSIGMSVALLGGAMQDTVSQLRKERDHDSLTGLINRRALEEACAPSPFACGIRTLIACDLDHFKQINDAHGHACGDAVLRHVGQLLRQHTSPKHQVARVGGEEFVIILRDVSLSHAVQCAQGLAQALRNQPCTDTDIPAQIQVTASFGIVQARAHEPLHAALKRADALLYAAKAAGRNCIKMEPQAAHI